MSIKTHEELNVRVEAQLRHQERRQEDLRLNHLNGKHQERTALKCDLCLMERR